MMSKLETVRSKINEFSKELCQLVKIVPHYYTQRLNEISKIYGLQNQVAALSDSNIAYVLMDTIKRIAYARTEPCYETICMYLECAIKDLASGMDATDVLRKYDMILWSEHIGSRDRIMIVDDMCDIDKNILEGALKKE